MNSNSQLIKVSNDANAAVRRGFLSFQFLHELQGSVWEWLALYLHSPTIYDAIDFKAVIEILFYSHK